MGERKLKVMDVARATGVHRNMVALLYKETATRVDLDDLDKLCMFFGCKLDQLIEYIAETQPEEK